MQGQFFCRTITNNNTIATNSNSNKNNNNNNYNNYKNNNSNGELTLQSLQSSSTHFPPFQPDTANYFLNEKKKNYFSTRYDVSRVGEMKKFTNICRKELTGPNRNFERPRKCLKVFDFLWRGAQALDLVTLCLINIIINLEPVHHS